MSDPTEAAESSESNGRRKRSDSVLRRTGGWLCALFSAGLWISITICYIGGWDSVAVLTLFPYWAWALFGGLAGYAAFRLRRGRRLLLLPVVWILTALCFAD